jgi:hypothetical protein
MKYRYLILFTLLLVVSAKGANEPSYFPLSLGNEWTYITNGSETVVKVDARWTHPNNRTVWFRINNYNGASHWIRRTEQGRVIEWQRNLWYRLKARPWQTWASEISEVQGTIPCSNGATLRIASSNEQVKVPAGTFRAIHISFQTECADAGLTDEWFAEGVGLVKRVQQSFAGPVVQELVSARVDGKQIGRRDTLVSISVSTDRSEYWENHMPGPGPRPVEGPTIKLVASINPPGSPTTINFIDFNVWDIKVINPDGVEVWHNPKNRAVAPEGGVNRPLPAEGQRDEFSFTLPYGSKPGNYTVKAKLLLSTTQPEATSTFAYGWAY